MLDKSKTPILVLIVLILFSLFLAGGVFYLLQKEKVKTIALETQLGEVKATQKATETKLTESKKLISDLELKLADAQNQIDTLSRSLEQEKAYRQEASAKLAQLSAELEEQKKSRSELEGKLSQAQDDVKTLQSQLKTLDTKKQDLETKLKDLEGQLQEVQNRNIELGKVVVTPDVPAYETVGPQGPVAVAAPEAVEETSAPSGSEGSVLVVNKEYGFAVISLGLRDGIRVGDVFSIYHNNKYTGDVKVDKVHDAMSAAGFLSPEMKDKVSEGDKVIAKTR